MLQTFQYQNCPITFNLDGDCWMNATEMAKAFGKQPKDYLKTSSTQEFLSALKDALTQKDNRPTELNDLVRVYNGGTTPGTWMQEDVALDFAQWLSPAFKVWCNFKIKELLSTGKTELQPKSKEALWLEALNSLTLEVSIQKEQLQLATTTIKQQAPMVAYYNDVLSADNGHLASSMAFMFGLHATTFNRLLVSWDILDKVGGDYKLKGKYMATHKDCTVIRVVPYLATNGQIKTKNELRWTEKGRQFLFEEFGKRGYHIQEVA